MALKLSAEHVPYIRRANLDDLFFFARQSLNYKDLTRQTHGETIRTLESQATRKGIVLPRGALKSSLCSIGYPIWRLIKDPNLTILLDSEIYANSKNLLREIRGHLASEKITYLFGDQVGSPWGEGEITVKTRTRNRKESSITVGGIETTKVGQHYDIIIGDDYNSQNNSDTPEKCQKVINHIKYNLNILNPGGEYVFVGTRYAERDVFGFLFNDVLKKPKLAEGKLDLSGPVIDQADVTGILGG